MELIVPWRHHSGGFTDNLITDWHKLFGLPNADRDRYPVDDLHYRLSLPGHQREFDESGSGIGDVQISINRRLLVIDGGQLSLGVGAKMPTGKAADWLGSGATDFYTLMRFTGQQLNGWPLYWHGQVGATFAGRSELLGEAQKRSLWFAGLAAGVEILAPMVCFTSVRRTQCAAVGRFSGAQSARRDVEYGTPLAVNSRMVDRVWF